MTRNFFVLSLVSNVYLLKVENESIKTIYEGGEWRATYECQDLDGDGVYEILGFDSAWHAANPYDKERGQWAEKMEGHEFVKIIYKFDGAKYALYDIVPDLETEKVK